MKNFAFIACPVTIEQLKRLWPVARILPQFILSSRLKSNLPIKISRIKKIHSIQGERVQGHIFACPIFDRNSDTEAIQEKIIAAGRLAERLGADILGLDGCASIITEREYAIAKKLKIPLTNGSSLTAWSVFEAVYRAAKIKKVDLRKSVLTIIGATRPVGSLCTKKFSDYVQKIIITDGNPDKLERLKEITLELNPVEIIREVDAHKAAEDADIVVDVSQTISIKIKSGQDTTIIKGGLIKAPYPVNLKINTGLPKGIIYASLAEAILLTLENKFVSYSLGDNINPDKMEEIADIAVRHGFEVWVPEAPVM